jgi:hypothetical protein
LIPERAQRPKREVWDREGRRESGLGRCASQRDEAIAAGEAEQERDRRDALDAGGDRPACRRK